jgi:hypothetical protein
MDTLGSAVLNLNWYTFLGGVMSTSSCPQCGKQVTIPSGVGTSTKVRCPLCHSQYTLADALVNMPPLLELVEEDAEDYLDTQPTIPGSLTVPAVDYFQEASTKAPPVGADEPSLEELSLEAPLDLEATTAYQADDDHQRDLDDLTVEEKDTEVEELGGLAKEPVAEAPDELIAFDSPAAADDVLDFDAAIEGEDADTPLGELAAGDIPLDFGGDTSAAEADEAPIQFEDEFSAGSASEDDVLAFDNAEPVDGQEEPSIDFGEPVAGDAEGEELAIDFGQPVEAVAPVVGVVDGEVSEEEETDKKGKKKKKKEKKQKVKAVGEDGEPRPKRRLSTVLSATLGGLLGLVVALYLILWLGPDYDFVGLGKMLPKAMVPSSFNSRTLVSAQKPAFNMPPATPQEQPAPELPADEPAPDAAATEPPAAEPAAETPAAPADETKAPETEPATTPPADAPAEMPADAPSPAPSETNTPPAAEPDQPSLSPPAEADAPPAEPAATTPEPDPLADAPADPAADPFAPADAAATPSDAADEMPAPIPPADAATDTPPAAEPPAAEPPSAEPAMPPADDPFAPATDPATPAPPAAEAPAADAPAADTPASEAPAEEMPAPADDPFAESTTKPAPADDPFADSSPAPAVPAEPVTPEPVGPVAATAVTPDALAKAIQDAEAADQQMVAAQGTVTDAELKKIRSNFYVSLFRMADGATFVQDVGNSGQLDTMRQQMDRLLRQLAADPKRKESLKYNAGRWLEFSRRTTPGIILAGKVQSVEPVGKLHEIKLNIGLENAAESIVSVLLANDPGLKGGDEALVLGTIVENPAEQLAGYEGVEPTVVWNGMLLTLPPQ